MAYRTYDAQWNRTGYSDVPQYAGQADQTRDFPAQCPTCGKGIVAVSGLLGLATCQSGHSFGQVEIVL